VGVLQGKPQVTDDGDDAVKDYSGTQVSPTDVDIIKSRSPTQVGVAARSGAP
jgi:hypothetical protein